MTQLNDSVEYDDNDENHSVYDFARGVGGVAERLLKVKTLKLSLRLSCPDHHHDHHAEGPLDDDDDDNELITYIYSSNGPNFGLNLFQKPYVILFIFGIRSLPSSKRFHSDFMVLQRTIRSGVMKHLFFG